MTKNRKAFCFRVFSVNKISWRIWVNKCVLEAGAKLYEIFLAFRDLKQEMCLETESKINLPITACDLCPFPRHFCRNKRCRGSFNRLYSFVLYASVQCSYTF